MDMETFLEILKYILPSIVVFFTAYYMLKAYLDSREKLQKLEMRKKDPEITLPLRIQAFERLVLLLERISPAQLVFRVKRNDMSPAQFQYAMIQSIKEEFEHNIAQQIYISPETWNLIRSAREEIIRAINTAFISMDEKSSVNDLAQKILEDWASMEINPVQAAIDKLKEEVNQLFQ